jgi:hypothetical protein
MLITGACALQAFLTAAFNASKDIQQALDVGVKGLSSSGLMMTASERKGRRERCLFMCCSLCSCVSEMRELRSEITLRPPVQFAFRMLPLRAISKGRLPCGITATK